MFVHVVGATVIVISFVIVILIKFIMNSKSKPTREASASVLTAINALQTLLKSVETAQNNFSKACFEFWDIDDETCPILPTLDSLNRHYQTTAQSHITSFSKKLQKQYNRRDREHHRLDCSESCYTYMPEDVSVTSTEGACNSSGSRELFTTQEHEENYSRHSSSCTSSSIEAVLNSVVGASETTESRDNNDHPNISSVLSGGSEHGADDSVTSSSRSDSCSYNNFKRDLEASLCDTDTTVSVSNADLNSKTVSDPSSYDFVGFRKHLDQRSEEALKDIESWKLKQPIVQEHKLKLIQTIFSSEDVIHFTTENTYTVGKNSIWSEVIGRVLYPKELSAEQQNSLKQYLVGLARKKDGSYFSRNIKRLVELHQRYCPLCCH